MYVNKVAGKLEEILGEKYRVSEFYLDLDQESNPIKDVWFYKKADDGKVKRTKFEDIQEVIAPHPFPL